MKEPSSNERIVRPTPAVAFAKPPTNCWVVTGETGEYADFTCWNVIVTSTEDSANKYAEECQNIANRIIKRGGKGKHKLDPMFHADYNGTAYRVKPIRFLVP